MKKVVYSGNKAGWLTRTATAIQEGGHRPLSIAELARIVPNDVGTAYNDAAVTCQENGLAVNVQAGYRLWVEGAVAALKKANLVSDDGGIRWIGARDGEWKVRFAGNQITVRGTTERETARHKHMLGERPETGQDIGTPGLLLAGKAEPVKVFVREGHAPIKKGENEFDVHPLALAIPPMTADEQRVVLNDIRTHGVKVPLVLFPDVADKTVRGKPKLKILDGRHRAYFASVTGRPVDVEIFKGTEQEARDHVASLNLHRRQLTAAQRALAVARLYGAEAKKQAKKNQSTRGSTQSRSGDFPGTKSDQKRGQEWSEIAYDMAGRPPDTTPNAIRDMGVVDEAPKTAAKVDAGEIRGTTQAKREAKAEGNGTAPDHSAGANADGGRSVNAHIGTAIYALKLAEQEWTGITDELDARLAEIIERATRLRQVVVA